MEVVRVRVWWCLAGERVLQRLQAAEAASAEASGSGDGAAFHCGSPSAVRAQLSAVRSAHAHAHKLWQHKKMQLDQCFQLRLFEQDCEKVRLGPSSSRCAVAYSNEKGTTPGQCLLLMVIFVW